MLSLLVRVVEQVSLGEGSWAEAIVLAPEVICSKAKHSHPLLEVGRDLCLGAAIGNHQMTIGAAELKLVKVGNGAIDAEELQCLVVDCLGFGGGVTDQLELLRVYLLGEESGVASVYVLQGPVVDLR